MRSVALILMTTFGFMIGLVSPTPVMAATTRQVALTAPAQVRIGDPTILTATASDGAAAMAGQSVRFEISKPDGTWSVLSTAVTDASGTAAYSLPTFRGSATYRAVLPAASPELPEVVSEVRTVTGVRVQSVVSLKARHWYVRDESSRWLQVRFSADGKPLNGRVTLQSRKRKKARWHTVATQLTGVDGRAAFKVRPRVNTFYRVHGHAGTSWFKSYSPTRWLDNRPRIKPVVLPRRAPEPKRTEPNMRATGKGARPVVSRISNKVWRSMVGRSWHRGCPVGRASLRLIRINYWGFDGYRYRGEMVVNSAIARKTVGALRDMYRARLPIRRMYRVDRFGWSSRVHGADDYASMAADNSSAFNCRGVTGNSGVRSPHSTGRAVDLNTWENPFVSAQGVVPDTWWRYRSHPQVAWRSGNHPVVKIWRKHGFRWTYANFDSQHFDGRLLPPQWATMVG